MFVLGSIAGRSATLPMPNTTPTTRENIPPSTPPDEHITLDRSQPRYQRLANAAAKIARLLNKATSPELIACLDDFLGVIYSLVFATLRAFKDRTTGPIEVDKVKTRAHQLAGGDIRLTGAWMAGYYFNNALFRESAVYHRILKTLNKRNGDLERLLPLTKNAYTQKTGREWDNTNIDLVRQQVNKLKHKANGTYHARQVSYEQAVRAAEELLTLLEALP
jgi:hypothetical protein